MNPTISGNCFPPIVVLHQLTFGYKQESLHREAQAFLFIISVTILRGTSLLLPASLYVVHRAGRLQRGLAHSACWHRQNRYA